MALGMIPPAQEQTAATAAPRAPEAVAATTLTEKLWHTLRYLGEEPIDEEHGEKLILKLEELEEELRAKGQGYTSEARGSAVHVHKLALRGLPAFPEQVVIDVDAMPGEVISIVGPAGSGKSTFVEGVLLGLHKRSATRGTLAELGDGTPGAEVTIAATMASGTWKIHHRGSKTKVIGQRNYTQDLGDKAYREWARCHVPPHDLLLAGPFAAQETPGLLTLGAAAAKDLLLGMVGAEAYQRISARAGARARAVEAEERSLAGRIEELHRGAALDHSSARALEAANAAIIEADDAASLARAALNDALRDAGAGDAEAFELRAVAAQEASDDARRRALEASTREREARRRIPPDGRAELAAQVEQIPALQQRAAELAAEEAACLSQAHDQNLMLLQSKDARIKALSSTVQLLSERPKDARAMAQRALLDDRAAELAAEKAPAEIGRLTQIRAAIQKQIQETSAKLDSLRRIAAALPGIEEAERIAEEARVDRERFAAQAEQAQAEHDELMEQASQARASQETDEVKRLRLALEQAEKNLADKRTALGAAQAARAAAQRAAERLGVAQEEFMRKSQERSDWTLLERAFGRSGIQALEVDAMGPAIQEVANKLLGEVGLGERWRIAIDTVRQTKGGDDAETFVVRVEDLKRGKGRPARTYSPGERAVLSEAVRAGLTAQICRHSVNVRPTLFRDEVAAPLPHSEANAWLAMLRAEARMLNASKVLVVTHDRAIAVACDARYVVNNGRIEEKKA